MSRFDRYLLSHLLALFGFFSLLLVAIYWINRIVILFDQLIGDGQSALMFLEFSLLTLPNVIRLVLPVSAFAAAVFVANRLTQDSELVVMQATGFSSFRLARPALVFGLIVALMTLALTNYLVPLSRSMMADRAATMSENVTARFLTDGKFVHPAKGLTLYIREVNASGELLDVFLADDRSESTRITYLARKALFLKGESGPKLIMIDGQSQALTRANQQLSVTRFADFTYDLGAMITTKARKGPAMEELTTQELLRADPAQVKATRSTEAAFLLEGHSRLAQPFLGTASALLGFATLLVGAFSRFGLWRQILASILLLILIQLINTASTGIALKDATAWPLVYSAPLTGIVIAGGLLWYSQRPRRIRGGAQVAGAGA